MAPNGLCEDECPTHLEYSPKGSTSLSQCLTIYNNIYAVSTASNRVTAFNTDTTQFELVAEAGVIDTPYDMEFITVNLALLSSYTKQRVNMIDGESTDHGTFAMVSKPMGILHLPHLNLVAIASHEPSQRRVFFFNLDDYTGTPLQNSDAASIISTNTLYAGMPRYLSLGELPGEILITTSDAEVIRMCIPYTDCKMRNKVMVHSGQDFRGVAIIPARDSYIVVDQGADTLFECPLATTNTAVNAACTVFAYWPTGVEWDPYNLVADHTKQMIYATDYTFNAVHVLTFSGDYLAPLHDSLGALMTPSALAIRAGPLPSLSSVSPPVAATAGSPINVPLTLRDANNNPLPDSYPIDSDLPLYQITATGLRDGLPTTLTGVISSSTLATITIPYAGNFNVTITSSLTNPQTLHNGAFQIAVDPAPTDAAFCSAFFTSSVVAGTAVTVDVAPFDSFSNPTAHPFDEFEAYFDSSPSIRAPLTLSPPSTTFSVSRLETAAGTHSIHVFHSNTATEVSGSPFYFQVAPGPPHRDTCEHSLESEESRFFDPSKGALLTLQVFAFDKYENIITDSDRVKAVINGDVGNAVDLLPPTYTYDLEFALDYAGEVKIGFVLADSQGKLWHLPNSPFNIEVSPPVEAAGTDFGLIGGIIAGVLVVASLVFYFIDRTHQRKAAAVKASLEQEGQQQQHLNSVLQEQNENLQDSLRKKKHSDAELAVMHKAMEGQNTQRANELKSVLIPSSEIDIKELLGQGGMGKVHLALYNKKQVAVKQLLAITDENCKRFRFECFITKELTHPNCVSLIGVCWDDNMLGCVIEYVDGGSLEGRIRSDWPKPFKEKITWKKELIKWATEAALGCQYLHQKKYFDEAENKWKDSIVHRDLKPDNMLVTTNSVLKLTDFGEARAAELNMTMTAVGTPIYICPEIIRNDRYDCKADTYSYGIVLVAMMRCEDTIINFFFNALMRKMGKKNRAGIGLGALNKNVEQGWRPTLPKEFYPGMIKLIWRCWDDDPDKRPDFDEIVGLLMGDVGHEIRSNEEPIFGSGRVIAEVDQNEKALIDTGLSDTVSRRVMDDILKEKERELDIVVMERDKAIHEAVTEKEKLVKQLKTEHNRNLKEKNQEIETWKKELEVLKTTGRATLSSSGRTTWRKDDSSVEMEISGLKNMLGRSAVMEEAPARQMGRTDEQVAKEASDIMSMLGR